MDTPISCGNGFRLEKHAISRIRLLWLSNTVDEHEHGGCHDWPITRVFVSQADRSLRLFAFQSRQQADIQVVASASLSVE